MQLHASLQSLSLFVTRGDAANTVRLKRRLLACLYQVDRNNEAMTRRIELCRTPQDLVLARADLMQFLAGKVGEQTARSMVEDVCYDRSLLVWRRTGTKRATS